MFSVSHEVNFPDYLWRLAQQQSGMSNPASWIRDRIGELLTGHNEPTPSQDEWHLLVPQEGPIDPLGALGIYAKTDRENFDWYTEIECASDMALAIKALASKDNPTAFLQWWADKQTQSERES